MGLQILGIGHAVPKQVVTNDDLAMLVDTSDEWIVSRTGIHTRHLAKEESNTSLALTAAQEAIKQAGIHPRQIGVCIVATISPDQLIPAEACVLAGMLSLPSDAICFDLNAACSGFIYAVSYTHLQLFLYLYTATFHIRLQKYILNYIVQPTCQTSSVYLAPNNY